MTNPIDTDELRAISIKLPMAFEHHACLIGRAADELDRLHKKVVTLADRESAFVRNVIALENKYLSKIAGLTGRVAELETLAYWTCPKCNEQIEAGEADHHSCGGFE